MLPALKAEFRKLTTVRSTYIITLSSFALVIFYSFYVVGFRTHLTGNPDVRAGTIINPLFLSALVTDALQVVGVFGAIVAVLLFGHEYRYNTIMYTLTLSNSRTKVLVAKLLTAIGFGMFFALVVGLLSPSMAALGLHAHHVPLTHQTFHVGNLLWRSLFYGGGYAAIAMLLALYFRNLIAGIVLLLVLPGPVEQLLGLALNHNKEYLPFMALNGVVSNGDGALLAPGRAALVFSIYLIVGWLVGWLIFTRRDAN